MIDKTALSLHETVAQIHDGATVMIGGFGGSDALILDRSHLRANVRRGLLPCIRSLRPEMGV